MYKKTWFSIFLFLFLFVSASGVMAQGTVDSTLALSAKLNELQMFELSNYLLDREMRKHPKDRDLFQIQKAETLFAMRKNDQGMKILNAISKSSKAYPFSRLILGMHFYKTGEPKKAIVPLEAYCSSVKRNPPKPNEKHKIENFYKAVAYLQKIYKDAGDIRKATEVTKYIQVLQKREGKKTKLDVFQEVIFAQQVKLDIAEQLKEEGKEGWEKEVEAAIQVLQKILDDDGDPTIYTVMAAVEQLKGYVMLDQLKKAKVLIDGYKDMTRSADEAFKKIGALAEAPSAKMYLWIAEYNYALAQKETDKNKRIDLNSKAITDFYRVISQYDQKMCPYVPAAAKGFNKAKQALEKDGKHVTAVVKIPVNFDMDRINSLYTKKEFTKVIPAILKVLHAPGGLSSENAPDLLSKLTDSYIRENKLLEATTVAGYMADACPDNPNTPLLLLKIGEINWKAAKANAGKPEGVRAREDALIAYKWYTRACPTHKYAADICMKIAMESYKKAANLADKVNEMPNGEEKLEANMKAREEFLKVIPELEYIVNNYSHTPRGKEAAFIMGNCYSNAFKYLEGSKVFANYCELETNNPKKSERNMGRVADAKFRMADNFVKYAESIRKKADPLLELLAKAPETAEEGSDVKTKADIQKEIDAIKAEANKYFLIAIENFKELTDKWMQKGGRLYDMKNDKKIKGLYDKTLAYIPWVYDYTGDVDKTIAAFTEFLTKFPNHKGVPSALKRRAFKYIEKGETAKAAKDFDTLSSKFPEQAKEIQPELAKAMYQTRNYQKSIEAVQKMFEGNIADISVANLRWIATHLADCGGTHPKEGAGLALKAVEEMLKRLKTPVLEDWVRKAKVPVLQADTAKREETLKIIKDQILLNGADASFWAQEYKISVKYLDVILSNDRTPYFYQAHFERAKAYKKLKQYQKALEDYGEITNALISDPKATVSMRFKTCMLAAFTHIQMGDIGKAVNDLVPPAMAVMPVDKDLMALNTKKETPEEKALKMKYADAAIFLTACCEKKLGNNDKADYWSDFYRKNFPNGKFKGKLSLLPDPDKAVNIVKEVLDQL